MCLLMHLEFDRLAGACDLGLHDVELIGKMGRLWRGDGSGGSKHAVRGLVSIRNIKWSVWRLLHLLSHLLFYWNICVRLIFHVLGRMSY